MKSNIVLLYHFDSQQFLKKEEIALFLLHSLTKQNQKVKKEVIRALSSLIYTKKTILLNKHLYIIHINYSFHDRLSKRIQNNGQLSIESFALLQRIDYNIIFTENLK